jgi:putative tryptophan/tyrosine transport system substrate-binding protein
MMSQVRRRQFLLAVGAGSLSLSLPALAQQEKRVLRIGYFTPSSAQTSVSWLSAFREGMAELRWVEGRDYVIDARYADGISESIASIANELVASGPDLLLVPADGAIGPLAKRTKTIPIVFAIALDPVASGFVASLQHPGGNMTGLTVLAPELGAKRLQLLKEAFPRVAHVVLLSDPAGLAQVKELEKAAPRLKMRITAIDIRQASDIEPAFKRGAALGAHAYMVTAGYLVDARRQEIVDRILRSRLPAIFPLSELVEDGGLMSYASSFKDNYRRAAAYVIKILKGAKPGDLPIEQPTKFELVLNLKTAKAMGFKFPQSILVRADRAIE